MCVIGLSTAYHSNIKLIVMYFGAALAKLPAFNHLYN